MQKSHRRNSPCGPSGTLGVLEGQASNDEEDDVHGNKTGQVERSTTEFRKQLNTYMSQSSAIKLIWLVFSRFDDTHEPRANRSNTEHLDVAKSSLHAVSDAAHRMKRPEDARC